MKSEYAKSKKLSVKQESILCDIQKATYEQDLYFINNLPTEVVTVAINAQKYFNQYENATDEGLLESIEDGKNKALELDDLLVELVKKYYDKKGIAISQ